MREEISSGNKMLKRLPALILFFLAVIKISNLSAAAKGSVLGTNTDVQSNDVQKISVQINTITAFLQKETVEFEEIPFGIMYENDKNSEYGTEFILKEGKNGLKTLTYLITFWGEEIIDKQLIDIRVAKPENKVISKGTKIVWKMLEGTEYGRIKYWYKMRVWATKYDANCAGCTGRTFSGTKVKQGVCATDPKIIPLGTNFYVPGYGVCRAEDIGGAIKGSKIDLGFKDASKEAWGAQYTDIYLLTNPPEN